MDVGYALILHLREINNAMRVLLINYRYFGSGGPERYLFNLKSLLESHGHVTIPFSIRYTQNEPSEYAEYFVSPLAKDDEIFFRDQTWTFSTILRTLFQHLFFLCCHKSLH